MARKPAPPTFRLAQGWQPPDLKAVMLARACAAAALDSPSAAHVVTVVTRIYSDSRPACCRFRGCVKTGHLVCLTGHSRQELASRCTLMADRMHAQKRLACAVQQAGELRDDIGFGDSESQSDAVCVHVLS